MPDVIPNGQPGATPAPDTTTAPAADDTPPKWFTHFVERIEGKVSLLGKDLGKIREQAKLKPSSAASANEGAADGGAAIAPKSVTHEDIGAAMRLGHLMAKLTPEAAAHLQEMIDSGKSYSE